jgi:hypothetical protein
MSAASPRAEVRCFGIVGLAYAGLALWWLWPLPSAWTAHSAYFEGAYPPTVGDFYLITWALSWDTHALVSAPWRLFHANTFHPAPYSLAYSEHFLGYVPLFAPTYWLTGNPILAVNVLIFATYPLCGLAMYALARRWVGRPAAAVAGFFFAFALFRYRSLPHFHQLGVQWFPVTLLAAERWLERARTRDALLLGAALFLQAASSIYLAYAMAFAFATYAAVALLAHRRSVDRRRIVGLGLALGIPAAVLVLLCLPYLHLRSLGIIPAYAHDGSQPVPLGLTVFGHAPVGEYLRARGVGPVGYACAALALFPPWRRGRCTPLAIGVALVVVGVVLSFGLQIPVGSRLVPSPYQLLMQWVPGLSTIRMPARFIVVAHLGLALLIGVGAARLLDRRRGRIAWTGAVLVVEAALALLPPMERVPLHVEPTADAVPPAYRWLAAHGEGRPLVELPPGGMAEEGRRMYFSTYHWLPTVGGYSAYPPATREFLYQIAATLPDETGLQRLVDSVDVGWVLLHRDRLTRPAWERWQHGLPRGLEAVAEWARRSPPPRHPSGAERPPRPADQRARDDRRCPAGAARRLLGRGRAAPGASSLVGARVAGVPARAGTERRHHRLARLRLRAAASGPAARPAPPRERQAPGRGSA